MKPPIDKHPQPEELRAFGNGKLSPSANDTVVQHLETCADCREVVASSSGDSFLIRLRAAQPVVVTAAEGTAAYVPKDPNVPPELANNAEYENLVELGAGGMGVVYKAFNTLMGRDEVLKVMNRDMMARPGAIERFRREVQSAARLDHPNIVRAYSARQLGELLVFSMEFVPGQELGKLVRARGPLPITHACFYLQQVANGLQHAHENGMVHRDIKPANLILRVVGKKHTVKILDFGLAKLTSERGFDAGLTGEGRMLGTPDYVAPEQILDAQSAGIRADIYSLGCTLYFLLAGKPPFRGDSLFDLLRRHQEEEPEPLALVRPEAPNGLVGVIAKMMAKAPGQRYQTPAEVAKALMPFVKHDAAHGTKGASKHGLLPIVSPLPNASKSADNMWETLAVDATSLKQVVAKPAKARRGLRAWAFPITTVALLLAVLVTLLSSGVFKVKTKEGTIVLEKLPPDAEVLVDGETVTVTRNGENATITLNKGGKRRLSVMQGGKEIRADDVEVVLGGAPFVVRIEPPVVVTKSSPAPIDPPGKAWSAEDIKAGRIPAPDFSKAKVLFKDEFDDTAGRFENSITDGATEGYAPGKYVINHPKRRTGRAHRNAIESWGPCAYELRARLKAGPDDCWALQINSFAQKLGASVWLRNDGTITVVEGATDKVKEGFQGPKLGPFFHAALRKNEEWNTLLLVLRIGWIELYVNEQAVCNPIAVDPKFDPNQLQLVLSTKAAGEVEFERITVYSLDGVRAATELTDKGEPGQIGRLDGHTDAVYNVAFLPDGQRVVSAGIDNTIRLWSLESRQELRRFTGHTDTVFWVDVSADGKQLLSASADKTVRLWNTETGESIKALSGHASNVYCARFASDGRHAFSCSHDLTIRKWDLTTGTEVQQFDKHSRFVRMIASGGEFLATGSGDNDVHLWDVKTGKVGQLFTGHTKQATGVALSANGQRLLSASHDGTVRVWNVATGATVHRLTGHRDAVHSVAFSPDERRALSGSYDGTIILWDLDTGEPIRRFPADEKSVFSVAFAPKLNLALSAGTDKCVRIWRLPAPTQQPVGKPKTPK